LVKLAVSDKVVRQKAHFSKSSWISLFKLTFWTQQALLKSSFTKYPN